MRIWPTMLNKIALLLSSTCAVSLFGCVRSAPRLIPAVEPLTRDRALENAGRTDAADQAHADALRRDPVMIRFLDECDALLERSAELSTTNDAEWLASKLYEDKGHPGLNGRWQSIVIREMIDFALRTGLAPAPSRVLRDALIDYAGRCPTTGNPANESKLALALTFYGGPDYPLCDSLAAERLARARKWATELRGTPYATYVATDEQKIARAMRWRSKPVPIKREPVQPGDDTCRAPDDAQLTNDKSTATP